MRLFLTLFSGIAVSGLIIIGCSSGTSTSTTPKATTVNVSLSDPAACQAPNGQFSHVYVTITDVKASTNANAASGDPSFDDLTPNLSSSPSSSMQVDLLGQANPQCFLAMLGSTTELQAGSYQQIRIILAPDSQAPSIANNHCGSYANCVVTSDGVTHDLALSSESKTGLKIPSGQIANGGFNVGSGQTEDLDINFNTCSSIVDEGNGTFRLKPVLHAGEVSTTATSINGTVISSATNKPLVGAVVAAELKDTSGTDRIMMRTMTDSNGGFVFCPLPAGTYDIVAVGPVTGATSSLPAASYSAGVVLSVQPGETTGPIPLVPNTQESSLYGQVTSQNSSNAGTVVDLQLAALQQVPGNGPTITVPQLPMTPGINGVASTFSTDGVYATAPSSTSNVCPTGTDCVSYTLYVPSVWPNVATYAANGATFSQQQSTSTTPVDYTMDALAEIPSSGGKSDCTPQSELKTSTAVGGGPLTATSGNASTLAFVGCQ